MLYPGPYFLNRRIIIYIRIKPFSKITRQILGIDSVINNLAVFFSFCHIQVRIFFKFGYKWLDFTSLLCLGGVPSLPQPGQTVQPLQGQGKEYRCCYI